MKLVAKNIREILGSNQNASHFRISERAIEFNIFSKDLTELADKRKLIESRGYKTINVRLLDQQPLPASRADILTEGVGFFNEERFWESHETLEQLWRTSTGPERDALQSLILTAAAFVHHQRGEDKVCLSVLERARDKIPSISVIDSVDLDWTRTSIDSILKSKQIRAFRLRTDQS